MIPGPIYEALPVIYGGAGIYTILSLEPTVGKISGGMLILAALIIRHLRKQYRSMTIFK